MTSSAREETSKRTGPRRTIFGVRLNQKHRDAVRLGLETEEAPFAQHGAYTGEWNRDEREGFGRQVWPEGHVYEGEWLKGKRNGKGTFWVRDAGTGSLRKQYAGDWVAGRRQGVGVYVSPDGDAYEGEWCGNRRHGRGKMTHANGDAYEGEWEDGQRSGLGVLALANGDRYEGQFLGGLKEGPGQFFFKATGKVLAGEWVQDVPKCGEYRDAATLPARSAPEDAPALPEIGLVRPDAVLAEAVAAARQARAVRFSSAGAAKDAAAAASAAPEGASLARTAGEAAASASATGTAASFSADQISQLREHFEHFADASADPSVSLGQLPQMLAILGQEISADEMELLLAHMGGSKESTIAFADYVDVVSLFFE